MELVDQAVLYHILSFVDVPDISVCLTLNSMWNAKLMRKPLWREMLTRRWPESVSKNYMEECITNWISNQRECRQILYSRLVQRRKRTLERLLDSLVIPSCLLATLSLFYIHSSYSMSTEVFQLTAGAACGAFVAKQRYIERVWFNGNRLILLLAVVLTGILLSLSATYTVESSTSLIDQYNLIIYLIHFLRFNALGFFVLGTYINTVYRRVPEPWWFLFANAMWIGFLAETALFFNSVSTLSHEAFFYETLACLSVFGMLRSILGIAFPNEAWESQEYYTPLQHNQRQLLFFAHTYAICRGIIYFSGLYSTHDWLLPIVALYSLRHLVPHLITTYVFYYLNKISFHETSTVGTHSRIRVLYLTAPIILEGVILSIPKLLDMLSILQTVLELHYATHAVLRILLLQWYVSKNTDVVLTMAFLNESLGYTATPTYFLHLLLDLGITLWCALQHLYILEMNLPHPVPQLSKKFQWVHALSLSMLSHYLVRVSDTFTPRIPSLKYAPALLLLSYILIYTCKYRRPRVQYILSAAMCLALLAIVNSGMPLQYHPNSSFCDKPNVGLPICHSQQPGFQ